MSSATAALGIVPTAVITLLAMSLNWGLCEYRGQECGDAKNLLFAYLGGAAGAGAGYAVGFNTFNPALRKPGEIKEETVKDFVPVRKPKS
jgi:hypothetical protein